MTRAVSIYLPTWSADLLRRKRQHICGSREPAILLYRQVAQRRIIACCCAQAIRLGVRPGMELAHARALIPASHVIAEPHDPERDRLALQALAVWALRFTPLSACDPPDGLLLDIGGCEHLFGGERPLIAALSHGLAKLRLTARVAASHTFGAAWALAHFGQDTEVAGTAAQSIDALPVAGLRIDESLVIALTQLGIERIGELRSLPRAAIAARYGPQLLKRLDQALGHAPETIEPVRLVDPLQAGRVFEGPTSQLEAVELTARMLLTELAAALERASLGVRRLAVTLRRADLPAVSLVIELARANRDAKHLWSLLRPRLERIHLGFGVEAVTLTAARTGRLRHEQATCWLDPSQEPHGTFDRTAAEMIDTLSGKLGGGRIHRPALAESHLPECVVRRVAASEPLADSAVTVSPGDRPSALFDTPEPAEVVSLTPEGWPLHVHWRGCEHEISVSLGPERLGPQWWRSESTKAACREPRDYFKAQDRQGRWLWLFRLTRSHAWFVHGQWA